MKLLQKYVYLIPIIQIIATFVVSFVDLTNSQWVYLGNSVGYSVLTSLIYVAYFCNNSFNYCQFTKFASIGLLVISIYNFISTFFDNYDFYTWLFDRIIFVITLVLTFLIPKNK